MPDVRVSTCGRPGRIRRIFLPRALQVLVLLTAMLLCTIAIPAIVQAAGSRQGTPAVHLIEMGVHELSVAIAGSATGLGDRGARVRLEVPAASVDLAEWRPVASAKVVHGRWGTRFILPADAYTANGGRLFVKITLMQGTPLAFIVVATQLTTVTSVPVPVAPPAPIMTPVAVPPAGSPTAYGFMGLDRQGDPYRWDRCDPIEYYVNPTGMPEGAMATVEAAFKELADASGLTFTYVGETGVDVLVPPMYSGPEGSIIVGFSEGAATPGLEGYGGIGGFRSIQRSDGLGGQIVSGGVVINTEHAWRLGFGRGGALGSILLHELGHVMNLAHVQDGTQIMYPGWVPESPDTFQAGDRAALNGIASLGCI
jgi:hypothetical protein